jgi:hypothetical protein
MGYETLEVGPNTTAEAFNRREIARSTDRDVRRDIKVKVVNRDGPNPKIIFSGLDKEGIKTGEDIGGIGISPQKWYSLSSISTGEQETWRLKERKKGDGEKAEISECFMGTQRRRSRWRILTGVICLGVGLYGIVGLNWTSSGLEGWPRYCSRN